MLYSSKASRRLAQQRAVHRAQLEHLQVLPKVGDGDQLDHRRATIEREAAAIYAVKRHVGDLCPKCSPCDEAFRKTKDWIDRCPISAPSRWQLSVFLAAEAFAVAVVDPLLTGSAMHSAVNSGERPVATTALANEARASAIDLVAVNALPPLLEQLCAGGRLSASPSRAFATLRFIDQVSGYSQVPPYWNKHRQSIAKKACHALLSRYDDFRTVASLLYSGTPSSDHRIDALIHSDAPPGAVPQRIASSVAGALWVCLNDFPEYPVDVDGAS